jgi:hypothetical protein
VNQNALAAAVQDSYSADVNIDGARISVVATSMTVLSDLIARLKGTPAKAPQVSHAAPIAPAPVVQAPEASQHAGKSDSAPSAAAASSAAAPADASSQAAAVSYEDVKAHINKLYAIKPQHAVDALTKFGAKKGPDLQPQQWPDFVAHAKAELAKLGG